MFLNITLQVSSSQAERDQITLLGHQSFSWTHFRIFEVCFHLRRRDLRENIEKTPQIDVV